MQSKVEIWNQALVNIHHSKFIGSPNDTSQEARIANLAWSQRVDLALRARRWPFARMWAALTSAAAPSTSGTGDGSKVNFAIPFAYSGNLTVTVDGTEQEEGTDYTIVEPAAVNLNSYVQFTVAPPNNSTVLITGSVSRPGWDYVYRLPANCLTAIALVTEDQVHEETLPVNRIRFDRVADDSMSADLLVTDALAGTDFDYLLYIGRRDRVSSWPPEFKEMMVASMAFVFAGGLGKDAAMQDRWEKAYERHVAKAVAAQFNEGHTRSGQYIHSPTLQRRR